MSAMMTIEGGKPWVEADADTAEAIDFFEYYARQMLSLKDGKPVESRPGEYNKFDYRALGVGVVISPWNFPFAIMAGTTVAAVVLAAISNSHNVLSFAISICLGS